MQLFDLCAQYIDWANRNQEKANEKIYNLCADYLLTDKMPETQKNKLRIFFSIK